MSIRVTSVVAALSLILAPAWAFAGPAPSVAVYVGPDINGDGNSDKIVENTTSGFSVGYLLDGVGGTPPSGSIAGTNVGAGFETVAFPDLNGDGKSDKVIENTSTGFSVGTLLDGTNSPLGQQAIPGTNVAAGYSTVTFADLNGDGKADKIIENDTTGYTVAYLMDGLTLLDSAAIPGTNKAAGYSTVGFPDLNGDGKADKVVENDASGYTVAFLMDGLTLQQAIPIAGTNKAAGYTTMGFPDINGDGNADKVVEQTSSGYTVAFFLDGGTLLDSTPIVGTSAGYTTVGFPDLNGDGFDDKVIQRDSDGNSVAFLLQGDMLLGSGGIPGTPIGAGYTLGGFPDLNGDEKADKVVTRAVDGATYGYVMDGISFTDDGDLPSTPDGFAASGWVELWAP